MVVGGVSGIGRMVSFYTGFSVTSVVTVINVILFVVGGLMLGKKFAASIAIGNYILKSRYIAFLLEFFFPIGAGHFYSGKTILACIKLGMFVVLIISSILVLCCKSKNRFNANPGAITLTILILLCILGIFFMQIFDLIGYAFGIYLDGNGVEMS